MRTNQWRFLIKAKATGVTVAKYCRMQVYSCLCWAGVCVHLQSPEHAGLNTALPWLISNYRGLTSRDGSV